MKRCSAECHPLCDFCIHYDFNGEPDMGTDGTIAVIYTGNGHCRLHDEHRDPESMCEDFHCTHAKV